MTYECTKNLYMGNGTKCFTKGKGYESLSKEWEEESVLLVFEDDEHQKHSITEKWAKHFKEVK